MEWHNVTMLSSLGQPYRIVDTGDSLDDLIDLSSVISVDFLWLELVERSDYIS
jgi:hypothetical protein